MIRFIDTPIEVKALVEDTTHFNHFVIENYELARLAWLKSRPFYDGNIEEIIKNDIPIADFVRIPLEFTVPNFIREILVSPRDHIVWSSTTRANPIDIAWPVYKPTEYDYSVNANNLLSLKAQGAKQDEFRMALPIGYCGVFSTSMSLRTLVKLCKFLNRMYEETHIYAFMEVADGIKSACRTSVFTDKLFDIAYENYEEADFLPVFEPIEEYKTVDTGIGAMDVLDISEGFSKVGSLITWSGLTSLGLRTHIIRHRSVMISDTLKELYIKNSNILPTMNLHTPVHLQASATKEIWDHVIGTRNCWIAQASLWQKMVDDYAEFMDLDRSPLPCDKENKCPFSTDNELRIQGKDVNPVCPKYLLITGKKIDHTEYIKVLDYGLTRAPWWSRIS